MDIENIERQIADAAKKRGISVEEKRREVIAYAEYVGRFDH